MSEMVDRVAKAIAKVYDTAEGESWDAFQTQLTEAAEEAIKTMREPTSEMLSAVKPVPEELIRERADPDYERGMRAAAKVDQMVLAQDWRKMIDAALEMQKPAPSDR